MHKYITCEYLKIHLMQSPLIIWAFIVTALVGAGYIVTSTSPKAQPVASKNVIQREIPAISKRSSNTIQGKRNVTSVVEVVSNNVKTSAIVR